MGCRWYRRPLMRVRLVASVGVVVAVGLWWWWPGLSDRSTLVLIVGGSRLEAASQPVDRRLREDGFTTEWVGEGPTWCDVPDLAAHRDARAVIVAPDPDPSCVLDDDLANRVVASTDSPIVVVPLPGDLGNDANESSDANDEASIERTWIDGLAERGAEIVDGTRLLGERGRPVDCLWWDDCPDGNVVAWDDAGLTEAGQQRVARMIVAAVR